MATSQKLASDVENAKLKLAFSSLIDGMRYVQRYEELRVKVEEAKAQMGKRLSDLDDLSIQIPENVGDLAGSIGKDNADELSKQIGGFATTAIQQMKRRIAELSNREIEEFSSAAESEKTKATKSLEAFLSASPLPLLDRVLAIKLLDGAYGAKGTYRCEDGIEYEFSFDTKNSSLLSKEFSLGQYEKELKIPVRLAKSWRKREPVPDFERLDRYVMIGAEATDGNLIATYSEQERNTKIRIVYSKSEGARSFLTVEYSDDGSSVNVTSEPVLNKYLNSDLLIRAMERVWLSINELERHKIGLTGLVTDGRDVLEKLDCLEFFSKSWKVVSPKLKRMIKNAKDAGKAAILLSDMLDETTVQEKLKLLGPRGQVVADMLGVPF